ncbi:hypothetical protein HMPREF1316_1789 [Olsenella profusa F0195]|uniref:Uncharacterized protein n=1 Tax=Olsenella profusa F0195 TaxID=1125712 RepID=U2T4D7_9ACTN|nr:hypothetical protein HMPREF1316_1789 [Olsenella profusa F0195]
MERADAKNGAGLDDDGHKDTMNSDAHGALAGSVQNAAGLAGISAR